MSNRDEYIDVPEPLYKYEGGGYTHDDNQAVLKANQDNAAAVLPKKRLKVIKKRLKEIGKTLKAAQVDEQLSAYDALMQDLNSHRLDLQRLKEQYQALEDGDPARNNIAARVKQIKHEMRIRAVRLDKLKRALTPARSLIVERNRLQRLLRAHRFAVEEQAKEDELLKLMNKEAAMIGESLQRELARLGFRHRESKGNKTITHHVKFSHAVTTADQHQFKIASYSSGLAGGMVSHLPQDVDITEILTARVMANLSNAIEREVWSPHIAEDVNHVNGAWIVVERMGLYEGIPKNVSYRQIMSRYETADHERIPIPAGLRKGRRINWQYLDSHGATHMMWTGITGSGKTVAIQSAITSVIERQSPDTVRFILVDLKNQGDFNEVAQAPHMLNFNEQPIISDIPTLVEVLRAVRAEMHYRQRHIGSIAKNIKQYNRRVRPEDRLPRLVILIDEYANTRRERFKDEAALIDDIAIEITQMGRASGIHLWIGIQQPRKDNMPTALRDNFTTTFVGHQASVGASQSVSGNRLSLRLPDLPGRMLALVGWKSFEIQMPMISDDDINDSVNQARASYGEIEPYQLHYNPDEVEEDQPRSERDVILETAFTVFDGDLKARPIYEHLKPLFSYNQVRDIVGALKEEKVIEYDGREYRPEKQPGNYMRLIQAVA